MGKDASRMEYATGIDPAIQDEACTWRERMVSVLSINCHPPDATLCCTIAEQTQAHLDQAPTPYMRSRTCTRTPYECTDRYRNHQRAIWHDTQWIIRQRFWTPHRFNLRNQERQISPVGVLGVFRCGLRHIMLPIAQIVGSRSCKPTQTDRPYRLSTQSRLSYPQPCRARAATVCDLP